MGRCNFMFTGLVGMRDALMYIQQIYLESHSYPEELEKLIDEKSNRNHTIGKLKLVRYLFSLEVYSRVLG